MSEKQINPYLEVLQRNLVRTLSLVDRNTNSRSSGLADRRFWAWKTVDFPNASMQSLCAGFARLSGNSNLDSEFLSVPFDKIALELVLAIRTVTPKSGGLAEAFPGEHSFCVTGQVLTDAVDAAQVLRGKLSEPEQDEVKEVLHPLANFLLRNDESHGIISNHLATSALAMVRWWNLTGDQGALDRAEKWLGRIRAHASDEGWFKEYDGADPGYQTWALSSLAQIHQINHDIGAEQLLKKGFSFVANFTQPNGSFANGAGRRLTGFMFSTGQEIMKMSDDAALLMADFSRRHINRRRFASLDSIDEPNLAPFFNDVVRSAQIFDQQPTLDEVPQTPREANFPQAGLYVRRSFDKCVTVSASMGGWTSITVPNEPTTIIWPASGLNASGDLVLAAEAETIELSEGFLKLVHPMRRSNLQLQSPVRLFILRLFMATLGKSRFIRELAKKILAHLLIMKVTKSFGRVERRINLQSGEVEEKILNGNLTLLENQRVSPRHMASQGYWSY